MLRKFESSVDAEFISLNVYEKNLLVAKQFHEATRAYEYYKSIGFIDLDAQATYVLVAESYNAINRMYGSGQPDILVLPISEVIDLYDFDEGSSESACADNNGTALIFDLLPVTNRTTVSVQESWISGEVKKYVE